MLTKEFIKLGHKAMLIASDASHSSTYPDTDKVYNFETIENTPFLWIKTKKYIKTASAKRVLSWLDFEIKLFRLDLEKIEKPDVVIVSSLSIFSILYGYYLKRKHSSFLVFEIRDIWPLSMTEEGGFSKYHPLVLLIGFIEKFGYKKADLIVGTMPKLNLHVADILGYEKPFHCSPLGFDPVHYKEGSLDKKNPFDDIFPKGKIVVGYAGSMGITNALELFIDTIRLLRNNNDIHFMLVGSGDLRHVFEKELEDCKNKTFLPRIKQDEVKYFLQKCDVLYLSTKDSGVWKYGQSMNKVVEYMLASRPIIASYTGYPSMINEANCGVFVKTSNAIDLRDEFLKYLNISAKEREVLGRNGREWIYSNRKYSTLAREYIDTIESHMSKVKTAQKKH